MIAALLLAGTTTPDFELRTFRDWIAGCDNGLVCQASAMPVDATGPTLTVRRGPEPKAKPQLWIRSWEADPSDVLVDGKPMHLRLTRTDDQAFAINPNDAVRFLDTIRAAKSAQVIDANKTTLGTISVMGASAALLFIDERQLRLGTQGASVARGNRSDATIPPPPALPIVHRTERSDKPPARLSRSFVIRVRKESECEEETDPTLIRHHRLDDNHTLASITLLCLSGAYNYYSRNYIIADGHKPRTAEFDDDPREDADLSHHNISWDVTKRVLRGGFKARGIGDCGAWKEYVWDGNRFRVTKITAMNECRGVVDFISVWRAQIRNRSAATRRD